MTLAVSLLLLCGAEMPDGETARLDVLADVAGTEITTDDFRARYVEYLLKTGLQDTGFIRNRFLQRMIEDRLLAMDALETGAAEQPEYRIVAERFRRKLLIDLYVRRSIYDSIEVAESDLEEVFGRINTSIKARHLYAPTLAQAESLYDRLLSGETFEDLAREVFSDSLLASTGGSLGYFTFDEMDLAFEDAAFALEIGEISRPVRTAQGYSIIQVEDRLTKPLLTEPEYASRRSNLAAFVVNRKRERARLEHARALVEGLQLEFEEGALKDLQRQIAGTFVAPDDEQLAAWFEQPLLRFTMDGQRRIWTLADFRDEAGLTDPDQRAQVRTPAELREFIEAVLVRSVMVARAESARLDETPGFEEAFTEAMTGWLAEAARNDIRAGLPENQAVEALSRHISVLRDRYEVQVSRDRLASLTLRTDIRP